MKINSISHITTIFLLTLCCVIASHSCTKTNTAPEAIILEPQNNSSFIIGDKIQIKTLCKDNEQNIISITLSINELTIYLPESESNTYTLNTSTLQAGELSIKLYVEDSQGLSATNSIQITLRDIPIVSQAMFTADRILGASPLTVTFTDSSTNSPKLWWWNFGDGITSDEQNPQHTYTSEGVYSVTLSAGVDELGEPNTKKDYITVYAPIVPVAGFTASPLSGKVPLEVFFMDTTLNHPTQWFWDFGDGTTSTEQHPVKTYTQPGEYYVALDVSNDIGSDRKVCNKYINVDEDLQPLIAGIYIPVVSGEINTGISFFDASENNPQNWEWDFGDGNTSSEQNPVHTYGIRGNYTVKLNVSNENESDIITISDAVTIYGPCQDAHEVIDIEGNHYKTVQIGEQCWMAENLYVSKYPDGTNIPYIETVTGWGALENNSEADAYCYYQNSSEFGYGAMYTYGAATAKGWQHQNQTLQGICPDGWHLPTDQEWKTLEGEADTKFYPGHSVFDLNSWWRGFDVGLQLKAVNGWYSKKNGENRSGFTALPGGLREENGEFHPHEYETLFWTASESGSNGGAVRKLSYSKDESYRTGMKKSYGLYVRCVKNEN